MKTFKNFREGVDIQEAPVDGVAKGSLEGDKHMCATKIFKEGFGEGVPIKGDHAEPDEFGNISWYTTMFDHGIETVEVQEEGVKILAQEAHLNHKKKMKEEVDTKKSDTKDKKKLPDADQYKRIKDKMYGSMMVKLKEK